MNASLLLTDAVNSGWEQWIGEGVAISLIALILFFILKALPIWKEVRLAEINVRDREAEALGQLSGSINGLAASQTQISETLRDVAIEQRRATDNVKLLQRVGADESATLSQAVETLAVRMDDLEETLKEEGYAKRPKAIKKA